MLQDPQTLHGRLPLRTVLLQRCRDAASLSAAAPSAPEEQVITWPAHLHCQAMQEDVLSMTTKQPVNNTTQYHYQDLLLQRCRGAGFWSDAATSALQDVDIIINITHILLLILTSNPSPPGHAGE